MDSTVVGVRFKAAGKKYYFDPQDFEFNVGDAVIVETVRGLELGHIIEPATSVTDDSLIATLKPVLRRANEDDLKAYEENNIAIAHIVETTAGFVKSNQLDMKLLTAEYTLDRSKLIVYFSAEGRVDFRDLVRDLAGAFRTRIELRQVGARDGAKFLGGIGPCGYLLCCNTFLGEFDAVSIKMAKNQNLSLNPTNISGLCGKLLCCIRYEDDNYTEMRKTMPKLYSKVHTQEGPAQVISVNILKQNVRVKSASSGIQTIHVSDLVKIEEYDEQNR